MKMAIESLLQQIPGKICILEICLNLEIRARKSILKIHRCLLTITAECNAGRPYLPKFQPEFRFKTFTSVTRLKEFLRIKPDKGISYTISKVQGNELEQYI
jgi:hypothetical protein